MIKITSFVGSFLVLLVMAATGFAQVDTGTLVGTVRDPTGAVVPNVTITATEVSTGIKTTVQTGATGNYVITPLKIGNYSLTATATGFNKTIRSGIVLNVQAGVRVDFTMRVGAVSETVQVSGAPPLLQTTDATLGNVVTSQQISEMPLNGRDYSDLATLSAGVVVTGVSNPSRGSYTGQSSFSVNGSRSVSNNFILDGIQNNSNDNGNMTFENNPDAIAEFDVSTTSYSAEFGRSAGGVINATTKSGTNAFHGELYEFLRNDAVDARGYFEPTTLAKAPYKQNQFGGTLGGPIKKDKTFFFMDYQGSRVNQETTYTDTVPTLDERTGDFSGILGAQTGVDALGHPIYANEIYDPTTTQTVDGAIVRNGFGFDPATGLPTATANMIPNGSMSTLAQSALALYPSPTSSALKNNYVVDKPNTLRNDQFDVRIDENLSTKTQIFGRYSYENQLTHVSPPFPGIADGGGSGAGSTPLTGQDAVIGLTQLIGQTKVNSLRVGFNRVYYLNDKPDYGLNYPPASLAVPGQPNNPAINGLAYFAPSGYTSLGLALYEPTTVLTQQFELNDTFTWIHGNHTIKMGPQLAANQFDLLQIADSRGDLPFSGQFTSVNPADRQGTGNSVADMLLGYSNDAQIQTVVNLLNRMKISGGFVEDNYKVSQSLTLDLGLRYDYATPDGAANNQISNFWFPTGSVITADTPGYPKNLAVTKKNNFAPRLGFAYNPSGSQKLVIRGGIGRFFTLDEVREGRELGYNVPFYYSVTFPTNGATTGITLFTGWPSLNPKEAVDPGVIGQSWYPVTPVTDEWNLDVEYQLPGQVLLTAAYVGNKGTHLQAVRDYNQIRTPQAAFEQSLRPYANYGGFAIIQNAGNSNYNALNLTAKKRAGQGLYLLSAFTWGKGIDDQPFAGANGRFPDNSYDLAAEKGLSEADVRLSSVTSFDYALPVGQGQKFRLQNKGLDYALGGWHVGGILRFRTGLPITPAMNYDPSNTGSQAAQEGTERPDRIGKGTVSHPTHNLWFNINDFPVPTCACFGTSGRDILAGPGEKETDLSLRKVFNFREPYQLEFRAEFYNAFNNPVFSSPDVTVTDGAGEAGVITNTILAQREIQAALKLHF